MSINRQLLIQSMRLYPEMWADAYIEQHRAYEQLQNKTEGFAKKHNTYKRTKTKPFLPNNLLTQRWTK